jgi:hypothetical protein
MDKRKCIIREWRESTEDAIKALKAWRDELAAWEQHGGEHWPGDFQAAFDAAYSAGLGEWADANPAGGGLDTLAAAVKGEELPEPERDLVKAIFGG